MRHQSKKFLTELLTKIPEPKKVLDVGSRDINGHLRDMFHPDSYTGLDMLEGQNVDVIANGHKMPFENQIFDLVISFDTFEHDDEFWLTLKEMKRVLKKGGYMVIGVPSRRCPEHDHPHDYWRFMPQSVSLMFEGFEDIVTQVDHEAGPDIEDEIYGSGRKV